MKAIAMYVAIGIVIGGAALSNVQNNAAYLDRLHTRQAQLQLQREQCVESLQDIQVDRRSPDPCER